MRNLNFFELPDDPAVATALMTLNKYWYNAVSTLIDCLLGINNTELKIGWGFEDKSVITFSFHNKHTCML